MIIFLEEAKAKAEAIVAKLKEEKKLKAIQSSIILKTKITKKLPKNIKTNPNYEKLVQPYVNVLRKTHKSIGNALFKERIQQKKEKKLQNINYVKSTLQYLKNAHRLKRKVKKMRREGIFPQPKSFMNYRKRNGLLKKNSIKI